jgi:integrase
MGQYLKTIYPGIFKYIGKKGTVYGIDYYDADGKKVRKIVNSRLGETQEELEKIRNLKRRGEYRAFAQGKKKTFNQFLDEYVKKIEDQKFYHNLIQYFIPVLRGKFGIRLLWEIDYKMLEDFRDERKKTPTQHGTPRSDRTVDVEMSILRKMFKKAYQWEWIQRNPFDRGEDLFYRKTGKRERALSPIEIRQLIDASSADLKPIILVAILTGLRKGDILNLQWKDIDLDTARITLTEQKTEKTRIIHLNQDMVMLFQNLPVKGEYVFPGRKGKPLTSVKRSFTTAIKKSGIDPGEGSKKVVFHTLRHSCVSQLIEKGADSLAVRNYINHASTQMTEHYAHLSEEYQRSTGKLLDGLYDIESVVGSKKKVRNKDLIEKEGESETLATA